MEGVGWLGYLHGTDSVSTFKLLFVTELLNLEPLRSECHAHLQLSNTQLVRVGAHYLPHELISSSREDEHLNTDICSPLQLYHIHQFMFLHLTRLGFLGGSGVKNLPAKQEIWV